MPPHIALAVLKESSMKIDTKRYDRKVVPAANETDKLKEELEAHAGQRKELEREERKLKEKAEVLKARIQKQAELAKKAEEEENED